METEFYKGESDHELIVLATGGLLEGDVSLPQQAGFPIMRALPSDQIFSCPHESLSSPYCYLKWDIDVNKKSLKFDPLNELILKGSLKNFLPVARIFMRICNSKSFSPTEFLGECHQSTDQTLMETLAGPGKSLRGVSEGKTQNVFGFLKSDSHLPKKIVLFASLKAL